MESCKQLLGFFETGARMPFLPYFSGMKIGFDAKRAFFNATGLGNYSRSLLRGLHDLHPECEQVLFTPGLSEGSRFDPDWARIITPTGLGKLSALLWRSRLISKELKPNGVDLYHGLSNELPVGIHRSGVGSVVTVHDLLFLHFPEDYPKLDRSIYRRKTAHACRNADRVIAVSKQTAKDLVELLQVPEEKIRVVYQHCRDSFRSEIPQSEVDALKRKLNLPDRFVLYVGGYTGRKNVPFLIDSVIPALSDLKEMHWVFAGGGKALEGTRSGNLHTPDVSDRELPALYAAAEVFVYPSRFEGFGIPILEAMQSGTPVVCVPRSAMAEVGGEAITYAASGDAKAWSEAIRSLWKDAEKRAEMREKGLLRARSFSVEAHIEALFRVYEEVVHG